MKNNKISLSSREAVTRDLPLDQSVTVIKQGITTYFNKERRRSRIKTFRDDSSLYHNGFTLIELLVVVLIIGILAAVALPQYQKAVWKSRFTQAKTMVHSLVNAEEIYYLANNSYTTDIEMLGIDISTGTCVENEAKTQGLCTFSWGTCELNANTDVRCWLSKNGAKYLAYSVWPLHTTGARARSCQVWNTDLNDIGNQICKAESGRTSPSFTSVAYLAWGYLQ